MEKSKKPVIATDEQMAAINKLNETHAPVVPVVPVEPTLDELKTAKAAAIAHALEIDSDEKTSDTEKAKAWKSVTDAGNQINLFNLKIERAALDAKMAEKISLAKTDICTSFGIDDAKLDELLKSETLRASFVTFFGKPAIVAKEGQTGKSLTAEKTKKDGTVNISAEVRALFDEGKTVAEIADMGYDRKRVNDLHWHWKKTQG